jgi:hypothetical protein
MKIRGVATPREIRTIYTPGVATEIYEKLESGEKLKKHEKLSVGDCWKALNMLAKVQPTKIGKKYSPSSVLKNYEGDEAALCKIFRDYMRSAWLRESQLEVDYRRFGNLTPMIMYAFKEHFSIKYTDWDTTDDKIRVLLGYDLTKNREPIYYDLVDFVRDETLCYIYYDSSDKLKVMSLQKDLCEAYGKKSVNYCVKPYLEHGEPAEGWDTVNRSPVTVRNMMLQAHLARPEYRIPGVHILDPIDWENVPDAILGQRNVMSIKKKDDL